MVDKINPDILYELILQSGLKYHEVAKKVGATQRTLAYWLNGTVQPDKKHLRKLAELFNVDESIFFTKPIKLQSTKLRDLAKKIGISEKELKELEKKKGLEQIIFLNMYIARRLKWMQEFQNEIDHSLGKLWDVLVRDQDMKKAIEDERKRIMEVL